MKMLDPNRAHDTLKEILNKKEYRIYQNESMSWLAIWWEKAKKWIAKQLIKLFPSIDSANGAAVPVLIAVIIVVIILLALSTYFIFRNVKRNRMLRNQKPLQSMKEINWSFQRHLSEARKQEALKEYSLSTRHLFLSLLLYFHEKEWLVTRIWKTNWDYYDELRKINQQDADLFFTLASFFDEVTYGERPVAKEEYIQFRTDVMKWLGETEDNKLGESGEENN
jgi:hypothetical protein